MWNLTMSRPRAVSPHRWTNHSIGVYKEMDMMMADKLSEDAQIGILRARAVIPAVNISSSAPKPPKKRFLEAAAAHEEQQRLLEQEQQQDTGRGSNSNVTEDNSALMHLAEMCVYYQAGSAGHPSGSRSPSVTGAWKCLNRRSTMEGREPIDPTTIYSISMSSAVQSESSPKAGTPFWGWASQPLLGQHELDAQDEEEENEEPLDLSGEETIRTNQQELIDHLVEKLCARPISGKFSSLVQKKLSLLEPPAAAIHTTDLAGSQQQNSSSEVSSSIDSKDSVTAAVKDVRRDLPLKKRDPSSSLLQQGLYDHHHQQQQQGDGGGGDFCDSSTTAAPKPEYPSAEAVTSTNNNSSKKPAPRSCKGKRYLEFMYEGRISSMGGRVKRTEFNEQQQTDDHQAACDQSSNGTRKRQRQVKQPESAVAVTSKTTFSLRGRNANKLRKLS